MHYLPLIWLLVAVMAIVPATVVAQNLSPISQSTAKDLISGQSHSVSSTTDSAQIQITIDSLRHYLKNIGLLYDSITAITLDENGRIWIGSKKGLWHFDGKQFREFTYRDGLFDKDIQGLFYSNEGYLWVATSTVGPVILS